MHVMKMDVLDLRYKKPDSVNYPNKEYTYTIGTNINISPSTSLVGVTYEITPLSTLTNSGLVFDSTTGIISGIASSTISKKDFTLRAYNRDGEALFTFSLALSYGAPTSIKYNENSYTVHATKVTLIEKPIVDSEDPNLEFSISPDLPNNLYIIKSSGQIEGILEEPFDSKVYTVTVKNDMGNTDTTVTLRGIWPSPTLLEYSQNDISILKGNTYESDIPTQSQHITSFTTEPTLPYPFTINQSNGVIYTTAVANDLITKSS